MALPWRNVVVIMLSRQSCLHILQGMPGGGNIGTLAYTSLPDTLVKELLSCGVGPGVGVTAATTALRAIDVACLFLISLKWS